MILATSVAPPSFIFGVENDEDTTAMLSSAIDSTVAAVYYKPKENRPEQMKRHEMVQ